MELDSIMDVLLSTTCEEEESSQRKKEKNKKTKNSVIKLELSDKLTSSNAPKLQKVLEKNWDKVIKAYENEEIGAKKYFKDLVDGCKKICAVDIGWAGSGAISMSYLLENVWKFECDLTGIIAGTNSIHNFEVDASETFLLNGKLVSYMYSWAHNRDLFVKHDPNKNYNVFWELLLSSPTKQFKGFGVDEKSKEVQLKFGESDYNPEGMMEIRKGILDFVANYKKHFDEFPYMFNIGGRDVYAPMIVASSHKERYLNVIEKKFALEVNVS